MNRRKARFTELVHMTGKYQVYICHIWSTARFLAFFVFAARRDVLDLACLRILSVFATERPPIRGWGLAPACQSFAAMCRSRKRDCPSGCEIPGLIRQHSRIQRPVRHHTLKSVSQALEDPGTRLV
jgi:hypothetical protein